MKISSHVSKIFVLAGVAINAAHRNRMAGGVKWNPIGYRETMSSTTLVNSLVTNVLSLGPFCQGCEFSRH